MYAIVVIGRNEGDRLVRCLESLKKHGSQLIYVDSGSSDMSVANARRLGAITHSLDPNRPFTAARARHEGLVLACELFPDLQYVQFVDGDCEVDPGWVAAATDYLQSNPCVAAVSGRRRERFPRRTLYNRLCDEEWNRTPGEARSCGGDAMYRVAAYKSVGGFRQTLIAGEEPELCFRLRQANWRIQILGKEMTRHDAQMNRFSQWWTRMRRGGFAYAEGVALHGASPERYCLRESLRAWLWVLGPTALCITTVSLIGPFSLIAFSAYPAQLLRLSVRNNGRLAERVQSASFAVLSKFPEFLGQMDYLISRARRKPKEIIEYK